MSKTEKQHPQARNKELVTREVADELLVYDLKHHQAHCLNQSAAQIWEYCDGKNSVDEIARRVRQKTKSAMDEATIWLALDQLSQAHLLEERVSRPVGIPRLTRREAIRKIALGASLTLPVVTSVVAPTALMAATPGVCAQACRERHMIGSAAFCGECATVPGVCWSDLNCSGSNISTTCQDCTFISWEPT